MTSYERTRYALDVYESIRDRLNEFSVTKLTEFFIKSGNTIPPRRGLKDRTYKQILINKLAAEFKTFDILGDRKIPNNKNSIRACEKLGITEEFKALRERAAAHTANH